MANLKIIGINETTGQQEQGTVTTNDIFVKGKNMQSGSAIFTSSKKMIIVFAIPFLKVPRIALTLMANTAAPTYSTAVTKTGFTINFQTNFSGEVEWMAFEREN